MHVTYHTSWFNVKYPTVVGCNKQKIVWGHLGAGFSQVRCSLRQRFYAVAYAVTIFIARVCAPVGDTQQFYFFLRRRSQFASIYTDKIIPEIEGSQHPDFQSKTNITV